MFKYWLDIGFDGLYLDNVQYLFEDKDFKNDTITTAPNMTKKYESFSHKATSNLPETKDLLSRWGNIIRNYSG